MKKIILTALMSIFLTASSALAADVVISITIPDAYVSRLATAVGSLNCTVVDANGDITSTLDPKSCLKRKIVNELADFVNKFEEAQAKQSAEDAYNVIYQDYLNTHVEIPIN